MHNQDEAKKIINAFVENTNPAHGALFINGEWGVGKTHLIKKIEQDLKPTTNDSTPFILIHISLFGKTTTQEIEQDIFDKIHTFLSNPKVKMATQITKGFLKGVLKIDLNNDGDKDTLNINLTQINFNELISHKKERYILAFDDLERCDIPYQIALGYINQFVEHDQLKVIIIGDKKHIDDKEKAAREHNQKQASNPVSFSSYWEKLISLRIDYKPRTDEVITSILQQRKFRNEYEKDVISKSIQLAYKELENANFRNLGAILDSYDSILNALEPEQIKKETFLSELFLYVAKMTIGYRSGLVNTIRESGSLLKLKVLKDKNKLTPEEQNDIEFYDKLLPSYSNLRLPGKILLGVLECYHVDKSELQKYIKDNYFPPKDTPSWRLASIYGRNGEMAFKNTFEHYLVASENREIGTIPEIYHFVSLSCWLEDLKILETSKLNDIYKHCTNNLDSCIELEFKGKIIPEWAKEIERNSGWQLVATEHPSLKAFKTYLNDKIDKHNESYKPQQALGLFNEMLTSKNKLFSTSETLLIASHINKMSWDDFKELDESNIFSLREFIKSSSSVSEIVENNDWIKFIVHIQKLTLEIVPNTISLKNIQLMQLKQFINKI
jgi:hypothetical protein